MDYVVETDMLTKIYGKQIAVNNLSMKVGSGEIYAIVGPNGSGKTTMIRMLMGTSIPTSGRYSLFGATSELENSYARKRIGTLIETPRFYDLKTAYDNLEMICEIRGISDKSVIDDVLEKVGLSDVKKKKVGKFSLGMKQRLGLAKALIHRPEMLILDEPINGLDPQGVYEIRNMIKQFHEDGITIILASHILKELTTVATHYSMIKNGKIIDEFSNSEMSERCGKRIELKTDVSAFTIETLAPYCAKIEHNDGILKLHNCKMDTNELIRFLMDKNINIYGCDMCSDDLEAYFLQIMKE